MIAPDWQIFFTLGAGLSLVFGVALGYFFAQYFNWVDTARESFAG